jgi:hypothetical protein
MASRKIEVQIVGDTKDLEKSFNKAGKSADSFGKKMGGMAKTGAIGAAVGGIALLGKGLFDSVKAAQEAEKAETRFQGAMEAVNATAKQRTAAQEAINKVSRQAALDDEDLSDVYAKLARTTGSVTKAQEGMALAADIARARNISLEQAAKTVERAMLGNVTSLKKVGVEIEKGTTATQALEKAQQQFAGSAERYGRSAAGSQEKLGVAFENLQEKVGQKLLPVLAKLAVELTKLIAWAEANWPKFAKSMQPVVDAFEELWKAAQTMWKVVGPILEVALPLAFKAVGTQITVMIAIWKTMATVVGTVISGILTAVDKFLGGIQAVAEVASKLPFVGDKFRGIADKVGDARAKVRQLQDEIDRLRGKTVEIRVNTINYARTVDDDGPGGRGGRAAGGPVSRGTSYVVGEKGPEIFKPRQSGTIIPNHQLGSRGMAAVGGGTVVNVYGDVTGTQLVETVRREINRIQKQNSRTGYV